MKKTTMKKTTKTVEIPGYFKQIEQNLESIMKDYGVKSISEFRKILDKEGKNNETMWKSYENGIFSAVKGILMSCDSPDIESYGKRKFGILGLKIYDVFKDVVYQGIIKDPLVNVHANGQGGIDACILWGVKPAKYSALIEFFHCGKQSRKCNRFQNKITTFHLDNNGDVSVETHAVDSEKSIDKDDKIDGKTMKHWSDIVDGLYSKQDGKSTKKSAMKTSRKS